MLLAEAISSYKRILANSTETTDPALEVRIIVCEYLGITKEDYYFKSSAVEISTKQDQDLKTLLIRRSNYEPISHIINKREFFGLDFYVNSSVLDPRSDSEILVSEAIKICESINRDLNVMEIAVGSGCLSVALAKNCQNIKNIVATDISLDAIKTCNKNINRHNLEDKIRVVNCDLSNAISQDCKFDIIISNPPYIKSDEIAKLSKQVQNFDPKLALDGGENGIEFYQKISLLATNYLKPGGYLIFEIGFDQRIPVTSILELSGFKNIKSFKDYGDNDRVIISQF